MRISLLLLCAFLCGCTAPSLDIPDSEKSKAEYSNGTPRLTQTGKNVIVVVGVPTEGIAAGTPAGVIVSVVNRGKAPINFGSENISATYQGHPLHVFTYEELKRHAEFEAGMAAFGTAMAGASQSMAASMPSTSYSSGNFNGSVQPTYAPYRSVNYTGNYYGTTTTYDPAAASLAQSSINANTTSELNNIAANRNATLAGLEGTLQTTTIGPGQFYTGVARIKMPPAPTGQPREFEVTVRAAGETFTFPLLYK